MRAKNSDQNIFAMIIEVSSSQIHSLGITKTDDGKVLPLIGFVAKGGALSIYSYPDLPLSDEFGPSLDGLIQASSHGSYFIKHIKGKIQAYRHKAYTVNILDNAKDIFDAINNASAPSKSASHQPHSTVTYEDFTRFASISYQ